MPQDLSAYAGFALLTLPLHLTLPAVSARPLSDAAAAKPVVTLTPRETEILRLVAQGDSNPTIAGKLYVGEATVKTHLLHAFDKLGVSDRTRAVTKAMELGLL